MFMSVEPTEMGGQLTADQLAKLALALCPVDGWSGDPLKGSQPHGVVFGRRLLE